MQFIFFDSEDKSTFNPINLNKPTFDLTLGTTTILQNLTTKLSINEYKLSVDDYLAETVRLKHRCEVNPNEAEGETILLNGRLLINEEVRRTLGRKGKFAAYVNQILVMAKVSKEDADVYLGIKSKSKVIKMLKKLERVDLPESSLIMYPWQLIELNPSALTDQAKCFPQRNRNSTEGEVIGSRDSLLVDGEATIEPHVTFDARKGPICIGHGAEIQSFSRIQGPAFIGKNSQIRSGLIRSGTSIGTDCRIGGEVDSTIISSYSNKSHDGYIGHSYIGEWVNIGAGSSNSDMKNTYGSIKINVNGTRIDSNNIKIGCFISDYSKISIGCYIYTGKRIGVAAQTHGYVCEDVPSFTIYSKTLKGRNFELQLESAVETQKRMMSRRSIKQTSYDTRLLKAVFEATQDERYRKGVLKDNPHITD